MVSNVASRMYEAKCFLTQLGGLIVVVALITRMAFVPESGENGWTCSWDCTKVMFDRNSLFHVLGFGAFGLFLSAVSARRLGRSIWSVGLVTLVFGTAFGVGIEIAQPFVGRVCDTADMVVDVAGAGLGFAAWVVMLRITEGRRSRSATDSQQYE